MENGVYTFDGTTDIEDASEALNKDLPEGEYDTLAGFIMSLTGDIPKVNEKVEYENLTFTILEMDDMRIEKVKVEVASPDDNDDDGENEII